MNLIRHCIYFVSCVLSYFLLVWIESGLLSRLLDLVCPYGWFWIDPLIMILMMLFVNPVIVRLIADLVSRFTD